MKKYRAQKPHINRQWKQKNRSVVNQHNHRYYKNNKDTIYALNQKWRKSHPQKVKIYARKSARKYLSITQNRLSQCVAASIRRSLKGKGYIGNWEALLGYTIDELKKHLEALFKKGMSWDNYGKWHIDHIIPINFFQFNDVGNTEFRMCWRLENLQPLWAKENLSKGSKISGNGRGEKKMDV
jgi:hypothetical protein